MKKYTFQRGKSKSRIDLTLVGCDNANKVISSKISNCPFSDHNLNIIKLKTDDIERGPGSWIINLNTIKSDYLKKKITEWWKLWVTEKIKFVNLREWQDVGKIKIKSLTIEPSKKINKSQNKIKILRVETRKSDIQINLYVLSE